MYLRDIPRLPIEITRTQFVNNIFEIGNDRSQDYDLMMTAVRIGDLFVNNSQNRKICTWSNRGSSEPFMNEPIPPIYSNELAHVCLIISSKFRESDSYSRIIQAAIETDNGIVYKMEWEVLSCLDFCIPKIPFIICLGLFTPKTHTMIRRDWGELMKDLCSGAIYMENPFTILLAVKLLYRSGRLRADLTYRQIRFLRIMTILSKEYEVSLVEILRTYIQCQQNF
jgi:hypothetical protein